jgi:predicted benzoate:H+ symporter BenE
MTTITTSTPIVIIALVAALAVLGVVVVTVAETIQQAEARGCPLGTPAPNASKARCFRG